MIKYINTGACEYSYHAHLYLDSDDIAVCCSCISQRRRPIKSSYLFAKPKHLTIPNCNASMYNNLTQISYYIYIYSVLDTRRQSIDVRNDRSRQITSEI